MINSLQGVNGNDRLVLGAPFFTSAYMMVDNDRQQFTLWKSQPTNSSNTVALSAPGCHNDTPVSSTTLSAPTSSPSAVSPRAGRASVSPGAIVGPIIGVLAVLSLLRLTYFLLKRVRTRKQDAVLARNTAGPRPVSPIPYKPELATDQQPPQEMPLVPHPGLVTAPYEMSEGRSNQELASKDIQPLTYEMLASTPSRSPVELPGLNCEQRLPTAH